MKPQNILLGLSTFFIALLLIMPMVSAYEFDNIKAVDYDKMSLGYPEITIKNSILWIIPLSPIADIKLTKQNKDCLINCNDELNFDTYEDVQVQDIRFIENEKEVNVPYSLYTKELETYTEKEIDYDKSTQTCEMGLAFPEAKSEIELCGWNYVYKDVEKVREIKVPYTLNDIISGKNKILGIDATKGVNQNVDYQLKVNGVWLNELAWWDATYGARKTINITGDIGESLVNFTVYLNISYDSDMQADFDDIRFVNNACSGTQTQEINYEIDTKVNSNSAGIWVKIPNLNTGTNQICMYYGNSGASAGNNPQNSWDTYYTGVYHFSEGTGTKTKDSLTLNNASFVDTDGNKLTWVTGANAKIGKALSITAGTGAVGLALNNTKIVYTQPQFTGEVFVKPTSSLGTADGIISGLNSNGVDIRINPADTKIIFRAFGGTTFNTNLVSPLNQDSYISAGYNGANALVRVNLTAEGSAFTSPAGTDETFIGALLQNSAYQYIGYIDELRFSNISRTSGWTNRSYRNTDLSLFSFGAEEINSALLVATQSYPVNNFKANNPLVSIGCNFTSTNQNISNVKLNVYDSSNNLDYTNTTLISGVDSVNQTWTTTSLTDDTYNWACYGYGNLGINSSTSNLSFTLDSTSPTITFISPIGNQGIQSLPYNVTLNYTANDANLQKCGWNSTWSATLNYTANCNTTTIISVPNGNTNRIYVYANDSFGNSFINFSEFYVSASPSSIYYNTSTYESSYENFYINVNATSTISNPYFSYGGTNYTATSINSGLNYTLSRQISVPSGSSSKSAYFGWFQGANHSSTSLVTQTINGITFGICNASNTIRYINITFKNETVANEDVNATITTSTWNYYLDDSLINKSYSYSNNSVNGEYNFCFTPSFKTPNIQFSLSYANPESLQRSIGYDNQIYTNSSIKYTFYLLPTTQGLYTRYKTVSSTNAIISGVLAQVYKTGTSTLVSSQYTDSAGMAVFFLNPNNIYDYVFTKTGYTTTTFSLLPNSADTYTVTMGSGVSSFNGTTIVNNLTSTILPSNSTLQNNTSYTFSFNVIGNDITFISMNLTNSTSLIAYVTNSGSGTISSIQNTGGNSEIVGTYVIQTSSETLTYTRIWNIDNYYEGDYSLYKQLSLFSGYGFSDFWRILICLSIILGIMVYLSSSEIIDTSDSKIAVAILLVWAFSLVGWLNTGLSSSTNSLAYLSNQFGIAIIMTSIGAYLWIRRIQI